MEKNLKISNGVNKGFTLIEVLITLSIVVIIASLIFASYPEFKEGISLKRTSQEIALTIREAQNYALSVKEFEGEYKGYGVHFEKLSPASYILFSDLDEDNEYDVGEKFKEFIIQTNDKITDLCGYDTGYVCDQNYLDIIFLRPSPVVTLKSNTSDVYSGVKIVITSPRGKEKSVIVWISGQISIQ